MLSAELQDLTARIDSTLVLGNSRYLSDDFGDVFGRWFTVGALAKHAVAIAAKSAPFTLQVTAYAAADGSVSTTRQLILTRPDSRALVADFEGERGYLGLKAREIKDTPPEGEAIAHTSTEQTHGGTRSLLIEWEKNRNPTRFVSIDPPLPGVPVELSVWVFGDSSGVLFYRLIGDQRGINHGLPNGQWDLFLPRTEGLLQNAVPIDWNGWRELKFRLPPVGVNWNEPIPALGFLPNHPLGVHLATDTTGAQTPSGKLYVDDLSVTPHLLPEKRVELTLERAGESNFHPPARGAICRARRQEPRAVLRHRNHTNFTALAEGGDADAMVERLLKLVPES